jgi:hypothetical protein
MLLARDRRQENARRPDDGRRRQAFLESGEIAGRALQQPHALRHLQQIAAIFDPLDAELARRRRQRVKAQRLQIGTARAHRRRVGEDRGGFAAQHDLAEVDPHQVTREGEHVSAVTHPDHREQEWDIRVVQRPVQDEAPSLRARSALRGHACRPDERIYRSQAFRRDKIVPFPAWPCGGRTEIKLNVRREHLHVQHDAVGVEQKDKVTGGTGSGDRLLVVKFGERSHLLRQSSLTNLRGAPSTERVLGSRAVAAIPIMNA